MSPGGTSTLLCLSPSFAPETTPTAIRAGKLLERLSAEWNLVVITEGGNQASSGRMRVEVVRGHRPRRLLAALRRLRLARLIELFVWPDESIFWVLPAVRAGRRLVRELRPEAIVVFMMPYSAGLAGIALARISGLPLILNLDDSPTCTDMHPHFPTRLHYRLARALEDLYVRRADATVYVSQTNLDLVRSRQSEDVRQRLHLVRYGADPTDLPPGASAAARTAGGDDREHASRSPASPATTGRPYDFEIVYVGAMSGWWALTEQRAPAGPLTRAYGAWTRLGRYERTELDQRTSSPAIIGQAILDAISAHPGWEGRVGLTVYGNPYPASLVERALADSGVQGVVSVHGPIPHERIAGILARADLLFITLPKRLDGSAGGRISAKTYEYLMTDRPILAAVPRGENWNYLADRPGVWLVEPDDRLRMGEIVGELAGAKFAGRPLAVDRERLREELSYETRAAELAAVIRTASAPSARESAVSL